MSVVNEGFGSTPQANIGGTFNQMVRYIRSPLRGRAHITSITVGGVIDSAALFRDPIVFPVWVVRGGPQLGISNSGALIPPFAFPPGGDFNFALFGIPTQTLVPAGIDFLFCMLVAANGGSGRILKFAHRELMAQNGQTLGVVASFPLDVSMATVNFANPISTATQWLSVLGDLEYSDAGDPIDKGFARSLPRFDVTVTHGA